MVSRGEQRGGLFLATALYGIAAGGLFSIAFAVLRGRGSQRTDWELSTRLAGAIFVAIVLVPWLKYPPNPPAVGDPDTIGDRTSYYLVLLLGSALAMFAAARVMWSMRPQTPPWARPLAGAATFIVVAGGLALSLPGIQEVPKDFPAPLLWEFRLSSLGHAGRAVGGARDRLRDRDLPRAGRRRPGARRGGFAGRVRRLLLIRHASTDAVRRAAFPVDEPLDAAGRAAAALLAGRLGRGDALCSPARRARETAAAAGLDAGAGRGRCASATSGRGAGARSPRCTKRIPTARARG